MLDNVIEDIDFANLMKKNIQDIVIHFFEKEQNFGILCKIEHLTFDPELPKNISDDFQPMTLFFIVDCTESIMLGFVIIVSLR